MKFSLVSIALAGFLALLVSGCQSPDVIVINNPPPTQVPKPPTTTRPSTPKAPPRPMKSDPTTIEPVKPPQVYSHP